MEKPPPFTRYQKFIVAAMAFLQFTIVLDFMILSPLGAILMPALNISTRQFGEVVSGYAFAAGISGILAAGYADRFDRKKILVVFYTGFILGTLFCALAPNYQMLLAARIVTGFFAGVIGSIAGAIVTDLFSYQMRGRVMGIIQTAFAGSQVLGIPAGLYFSNHWGWHAPFLMIVVFGILVGAIILFYMKPVTEHLAHPRTHSAFRHLQNTITNRRYFAAFMATALLSTGGFMLMPFGSAFTVHNMKIDIDKLPLMYLISGVCAMVTGPLVGRMSDSFGKMKVFLFGSLLAMIMCVIYTNLQETPWLVATLVNVILFVGIFSRMIPSQAMMSAIPDPASRGAFMSISSSLQQVAGGIASVIAGVIVVQNGDGPLEHFDVLGYILVGTTAVTIFIMHRIHRTIHSTPQVA